MAAASRQHVAQPKGSQEGDFVQSHDGSAEQLPPNAQEAHNVLGLGILLRPRLSQALALEREQQQAGSSSLKCLASDYD